MRKIIFFIFCFFCLIAQAQFHVSGIVKDNNTKEILPFATIITQSNLVLITDAKGYFNINSKRPITKLTISYIGYKTKEIFLDQKKFLTIYLQPTVESLQAVVLNSKENPALAIIRKTIKNKDLNDVNKALDTYKYISYNKLLVTGNPDSIKSEIDSIFKKENGKKTFVKLDSSNFKFKKELQKHHLYIAEKISKHKYQKGKNKKEIYLASRMSGLKNPLYE